jgi:hypothetical protein
MRVPPESARSDCFFFSFRARRLGAKSYFSRPVMEVVCVVDRVIGVYRGVWPCLAHCGHFLQFSRLFLHVRRISSSCVARWQLLRAQHSGIPRHDPACFGGLFLFADFSRFRALMPFFPFRRASTWIFAFWFFAWRRAPQLWSLGPRPNAPVGLCRWFLLVTTNFARPAPFFCYFHFFSPRFLLIGLNFYPKKTYLPTFFLFF